MEDSQPAMHSEAHPDGASAGERTDRYKSTRRAVHSLKFVTGDIGWPAIEKNFDMLKHDGLLLRSRFGKCIGMHGSDEFAVELFDALARRCNISVDCINKLQLMKFWNQISGQSSDTCLQTFFDMMDKDADGRITEEDIKKIIVLSSSANKLHMQAEESARLIMAELDPDNHGYIETYKLERLFEESVSASQWGQRRKSAPRASRGNEYGHVEKQSSSSFGHAVIRNASSQVEQVSQELRRLRSISRNVGTSAGERIDRSKSAAHALKALKIVTGASDGAIGWPTVEKHFHELSCNGLLRRSKFGQCIGLEELEFAGDLFDALARRRNICADCINKAELLEFWDQISDQRFDSRLQTFFDMLKSADGQILTKEEVKEIIILGSKIEKNPKEDAHGNKMSEIKKSPEEYARLIMEELDPNNLFGYIEPYNLQMMMMQVQSQSTMGIGTTNSDSELVQMNQSLPQTGELNPLRRWYQEARDFLEDNWKRVWVLLLWLCICAGLFAWKFTGYRRGAVFHVMGSCICVAKGAAETLKLNMALILLPVCRNTITWLRSRTKIGRVVPLDDNISFHTVISAGIIVGAGLHVVSHLTCGFPRLLHATDAEYAPMKLFFGEKRPRSYWWFVMGTEGWTGLVMLVLMAVAFTLATPWFRRSKIRLPRPLDRLVGFNAFWYSHHLFVVVYALLIVHGHGLYLTRKWHKKTTWMYLSIPMFLYACERFVRVLRSSMWAVKILKVVVYPGNVLSLHLSKPHGFKYKSGQYIFLNCPAVALFEWHPFSITSAPRDEHICIHMRTLGDWTRQTKTVFSEVCHVPLPRQSGLLRAENDSDGETSLPKVMIDGPYSAAEQDYEQYEAVLLIGLGIGITPMISIIKDISDNIKLLDDHADVESGAVDIRRAAAAPFRTRRAYLYWVTREQGSLEWFRNVTEEVVETDKAGAIELHQYCTSVYEEGDARSAFITMVNALSHDGVDVISGTRIKTHFWRPNWRAEYKRIALNHRSQRVGVFYFGAPVLKKQLRELCQHFSRKTSTRFEFHNTYI